MKVKYVFGKYLLLKRHCGEAGASSPAACRGGGSVGAGRGELCGGGEDGEEHFGTLKEREQ